MGSTRDWATAFLAAFDSVVVGALADSTSAFATAITGLQTLMRPTDNLKTNNQAHRPLLELLLETQASGLVGYRAARFLIRTLG